MNDYFFSIDYETTGFDPIRNDGITLGVIVLNESLDEIDQGYFKFKPDLIKGMNEDNVATHIHGFTLNEMLFFQERKSGLIELLKFLKPYKHPHNKPRPLFQHSDSHFDYRFMEWAFRKESLQYSLWKIFEIGSSFNTVTAARKLGYEGNSLDKWAARIGKNFNHHNSLSDAKMLSHVVKYLVDKHFQGNVFAFIEWMQSGMDDEKKENKKAKDSQVQEMSRNESRSFFDV